MANDPSADDARQPDRNPTDVDVHETTVPAEFEGPFPTPIFPGEIGGTKPHPEFSIEPEGPDPDPEFSIEIEGPNPDPGIAIEGTGPDPEQLNDINDKIPFDFLPLTREQKDHIPKDLMPEFMRRLMGGLTKGEEAGKDKLDMLTEGHEDYIVDKVCAPYYQINRHQLMREREESAKHIRDIARADNIPEREIWRLVRESQQLAQDQRLTQDEAYEQLGGPAKMVEMKAAGAEGGASSQQVAAVPEDGKQQNSDESEASKSGTVHGPSEDSGADSGQGEIPTENRAKNDVPIIPNVDENPNNPSEILRQASISEIVVWRREAPGKRRPGKRKQVGDTRYERPEGAKLKTVGDVLDAYRSGKLPLSENQKKDQDVHKFDVIRYRIFVPVDELPPGDSGVKDLVHDKENSRHTMIEIIYVPKGN